MSRLGTVPLSMPLYYGNRQAEQSCTEAHDMGFCFESKCVVRSGKMSTEISEHYFIYRTSSTAASSLDLPCHNSVEGSKTVLWGC